MWDPDPRISILLPNPEQDQNLAGGFNSKMTLAKPKYSNFQAYIIIYFFYLYLKNKKKGGKIEVLICIQIQIRIKMKVGSGTNSKLF